MRSTDWINIAAALLAFAPSGLALSPAERLRGPKFRLDDSADARRRSSRGSPQFYTPQFSNTNATAFHVKSSELPLIKFPVQDSWAGHLPISGSSDESRKLFFWYWPSSQSSASDTLSIWLNGGPGCSSMNGFLEENGPISWQPGTDAPVANPNAWTTASDVLWVDQPIGTGFSVGQPNITNESELSDQFYGFLQQFYAVFPELAKKKLFITGESYAGFYIPYIATRIVDASPDEKKALPLDLQGLLMNDGVYSSFITGEQIPVANFSAVNQKILGFSDSTVQAYQKSAVSCGYQAIIDQVVYPPKGKIDLPNGNKDSVPKECDLFSQYQNDAQSANQCFNIYRITDKCPTPQDHMAEYLSRSDVQSALHVPGFGDWNLCTNGEVFAGGVDNSPYSETLFSHLLDVLPRGITLSHGMIDSILFSLGDRITIQNMTWGGSQGFSAPPTTPLVLDGKQKGVYHSERNLTYIEVDNAGHMIPEDQPPVDLHIFKALLGQNSL